MSILPFGRFVVSATRAGTRAATDSDEERSATTMLHLRPRAWMVDWVAVLWVSRCERVNWVISSGAWGPTCLHENDVSSGLCEGNGHSLADTAGATGAQGCFPCEVEW